MSSGAAFDVEALMAEVQNMTDEQKTEFILKARTKQKANQKKYHDPEANKRARMKQAARVKQASEWAKTQPRTDGKPGNLYQQLEEQAEAAAKAEVEAWSAKQAEEDQTEDDVDSVVVG